MKVDLHSRRMFLQGAGKFALAMPFLPSLLPRELWAQPALPTKRYIAIVSDFGYSIHSNWYPTNNPLTRTFNAPNHKTMHYQKLQDFVQSGADFSPIFKKDLNPYIDSINFFRGLDYSTRVGHAGGVALGNPHTDPPGHNVYIDSLPMIRTIDHVLNDSPKFNPGRRSIALLGFKRFGKPEAAHSFGYNNSNQVVPKFPIENPLDLFSSLFPRPLKQGESDNHPVSKNIEVLDKVVEDYKSTMNSRAISANDRIALENMADGFSDLRRSLTAVLDIGPQCDSDSYKPTALFPKTEDQLQESMKAHTKVLTMAMVCDVVRVGTMSMGVNNTVHDVIVKSFGLSQGQNYHDTITHNHNGVVGNTGVRGYERTAQFNRWVITGYFIPLLKELSQFSDPVNNQSLLYNALVHLTTEHSTNHSINSMSTVLAGNAGGSLNTGYLVDYMDRNLAPFKEMMEFDYSDNPLAANFMWSWPGLFYNRLYATIFQALGLVPEDYRMETVPANAIATVNGYGYVNANNFKSHPTNFPLDADYNKWKNSLYDIDQSGQPLPIPNT